MFFRSMYELERLQIFTGKQNSQKLADLAKSIQIAHTKCTTAKNLLIDSQNPLIPHVLRLALQYTYTYSIWAYCYSTSFNCSTVSTHWESYYSEGAV